ncbi:MAG: hypothetical protein ABJE95_38925 [Byssovorax sp.]
MQLPAATSHYSARVRFGRYVARRLKRARLTSLATDATKSTAAVLAAGRIAEDADGPVQDAMADRDAADDDLDTTAQDARAKLAGRSADAITKVPYTQIFPDGIGFYTAAPLDEEHARYSLLSQRLAAHLPANDKVRTGTIAVIDTGLTDFAKATAELISSRNASSIADGHLSTAEDAWEKQMEKTYGALVVELGRAAADKFFPKTKTKSKKGGPATPPAGG